MNDVCMYSGLPYTCSLCPENEAPCYFMLHKKGFLKYGKIIDDKIKRNDVRFVDYIKKEFAK